MSEEMMVLTTIGVILLIGLIITSIVLLIDYLIKAISFFMIGKKAGVSLAWLAFIPVTQNYVPIVLPHRDYELAFIKPKKRITVFWILLAMQLISGAVTTIQSSVNQFTNEISMSISPDQILPDREGIYNAFVWGGTLLGLLVSMVSVIIVLIIALLKARMNYDLFKTYGMDGGALAIAIVGIFLPIVPMIGYLFLIGREPEYGYGNYAKEFREVQSGQNEYCEY